MTTADTRLAASRNETDRLRFFIGGRWQEPQGTDRHEQLEAATGERIGVAALGDTRDVDAAVAAARSALDSGPWGQFTPAERADAMRRFARALESRADEASELVSRENGMPITLSRGYNGAAPAAILDMYAAIADTYAYETVRPSARGATLVRQVPVGVVAAITPWNYPLALAMAKIAPALAAGCTVILKPSPDTALDSYLFADAAIEAGLPDGVLNIVLADRAAGAHLVEHPGVDKVAFTGSTQAGKKIGEACGRLVRRVTLELGGKSASVFLEDGRIEDFVGSLDTASFQNNSQTCTTQSRILVASSRYHEVVDALADYARELRVGDPLDPSVQCGPMANARHLDKVMSYIDLGQQEGARLVAGGSRPKHTDPSGFFVEPTVFADVDNRSRLATEEIFGPVLAVTPFDSEDEAVRLANDSVFGLAGSVYTADEERGIAVASRIRTGTIGVNYYDADLGAPFGGMKESGIGREFGPEALQGFLEYQSVYVSAAQLER